MCGINKKFVLTSMDEEDIVTSMNLACERKQKASNIVKLQMEWLTLIDKSVQEDLYLSIFYFRTTLRGITKS